MQQRAEAFYQLMSQRRSVRHFRLRNLEALEVLAETFERPQGYTLPPDEAAAR